MSPRTLAPLLALSLAACSSSHATHDAPAPTQAAIDTSAHTAAPTPASLPRPLDNQPTFTSPDDAVRALYDASRAGDLGRMATILGLPASDITTPDPTRNADLASFFAREHDEYHKLVPDQNDPEKLRLFIGHDNCPIASPLVRASDAPSARWFFDSAGGKQALIERLIDENELATIGVCRAYVQAQYEYYAEDRNGDDVLQYAQHLASTKGTHDGLYWHTDAAGGQTESPLGPLIAEAHATGYLKGSPRQLDEPKPYHGYLFRILDRQGPSAPGGAYSYIINNRMLAGFALIAYPAKYAVTGTDTFLVGANGKVYQKDLGPDTPQLAPAITEYNPDSTWQPCNQ